MQGCRQDQQENNKISSIIKLYFEMASKTKGGEKVERIKDPVSEMRIHRESLHKEAVNERINEHFQIDRPANINFYTQKPNNNPYLLMKMRNEGKTINGVDYQEKLRDGYYKTQLTGQINDKLKTVTQTPKDKWNVPQTSNQEIGWFIDKKTEQNPKFVHKREGCPQTHYADNYFTMRHVSLFSNKSQK